LVDFRILSRTRVLSPEDRLAAAKVIQLSDEDATYRYQIEQGVCEKIKRKPRLRSLRKVTSSPQTSNSTTENPNLKIRPSTKMTPLPQTMNNSKEKRQSKGFLYILLLQFCTFFIAC
jgi:hypothetical protein